MNVEFDGLDEFIDNLDKAINGGFKEQLAFFAEEMGFEFLDIVQDEIITAGSVDTARLLNSFGKGGKDNVWQLSNGGLTIEVGTNVSYATFVNNGYFQKRRFVPGYWQGGRFHYSKGSSEGMMLTEKFVSGSHYWDYAIAIFEKMFERNLEHRLQKWLDEAF